MSRELVRFLALLLAATAATAETHRFEPVEGAQTYAVRPPVLRVSPGDVIETFTLTSGYHTDEGGPWPGEVGPIYVEGATPEDTLVVEIKKLSLRIPTGTSRTSPSFAALTATEATAMLHDPVPERRFVWRINRENGTATLDLPDSRMKKIEVELAPMLGRVAVAPARDQAIWGAVPGVFGGNMDAPDVVEGTTVYLPIFHDGAYLYFGDAHALQGDGEIIGTGIETAVDVTLEIGLRKGRQIAWPRFEDDRHIMVAGSVRPLMDAFRIAHVELVKWLEDDYGFERWEALQVLSQVGTARVANVVDPNYTVVAKFPKRYLPK